MGNVGVWDSYLGEGALREHNQQTCLTAGTVTDDDQLAADFGHGCAGSGSGRSRERGVDLLSVDGLL